MSRTFLPWAYLADPTSLTINAHWTRLKDNQDLFALGVFGRNHYAGGSIDVALEAAAVGDVYLRPSLPMEIDNRNGSQLFAATNKIIRFRYWVRVSNSGITVTPKVWDMTANAAATISGQVPCSDTNEDFSQPNQQQTITVTPPDAKHVFRPMLTIGGSPTGSPPYFAFGLSMFDCYVDG